MANSPQHVALRAPLVFPVEGSPIADGVVHIVDGLIESVAKYRPDDSSAQQLDQAAILPGLVNAHTHLEFSALEQPLAPGARNFADWIREVVRWRRSFDESDDESEERNRRSIRLGIQESMRAGVTMIGEIATADRSCYVWRDGPQLVLFRELLGLSPDRIRVLMSLAAEHCSGEGQPGIAGLSPHAPYTVHPQLLEQAVALSKARRAPLAMHLAESPDELQLLRQASGPLVELLQQLGAWDPRAIPHPTRPLAYLRRLQLAHRCLVIHGNYLDEEEIAFLAGHRETMSVVHCARTHAAMGHVAYPFPAMRKRGVRLALGTDSRASNPDLSILGEMRHLAATRADLPLPVILRMGTINGAVALGQGQVVGSLAPGKRADLTIVGLPARDSADPHQAILHSEEPVLGAFWQGRAVWCPPNP